MVNNNLEMFIEIVLKIQHVELVLVLGQRQVLVMVSLFGDNGQNSE